MLPLIRLASPLGAAELLAALGKSGVPGDLQLLQCRYYDTFDWRLYRRNLLLLMQADEACAYTSLWKKNRPTPLLWMQGGHCDGLIEAIEPETLRLRLQELVGIRRVFCRLQLTLVRVPLQITAKKSQKAWRLHLDTYYLGDPAGRQGESAGQRIYVAQQLTADTEDESPLPAKLLRLIQALFPQSGGNRALLNAGLAVLGQPLDRHLERLPLAFKATQPAGAAVRQLHRHLLDVLLLNVEGVISEIDSECLHDFRVAARRTRSALRLLDKNVLPAAVVDMASADFRRIAQQTNRLRDLDVYLLSLAPLAQQLDEPDLQAGLEHFGVYLQAERQRESQRLQVWLQGDEFTQAIQRWQTFLQHSSVALSDASQATTPILELANRRIAKACQRLLEKGEAVGDNAPDPAYHQVRIQAKKLRYLLEFTASLYPPRKLRRVLGALKKLQKVLGDFQDAVVQLQGLQQFAGEMQAGTHASDSTVPTALAAMAAVEQILQQRRQQALAGFAGAFADFAAEPIQSLFAQLLDPPAGDSE